MEGLVIAKALKTIAIVAGAVALIATGVGALAGVGLLAISAGTLATIATIGAIASAVSVAASMGAQALTKPPPNQGTVSQVMVGANMAIPYVMGRTYIGGNLVHDVGYGGAKNPFRAIFFAGSAAGPIEGFESLQVDYATVKSASGGSLSGAVGGYYSGFMSADSRLGNRPDTALMSSGGVPGWGSSAKLSGFASWAVKLTFDTKGERYASGVPQFGVIANWVKVYDPRLDTTYPGGSGSQRWDDEATWLWSDNPGLHALTYARGRFVAGTKVCGAGLPRDSIDEAAFVELANLCEANGWTIGGAVYEAPGSNKWDNLKRILECGAAKPAWVGGKLTLDLTTPGVALDTITMLDVVGSVKITAMKSQRDRLNSVVARYRSEAHRWEYTQIEAVVNSTYLTEDGEARTEERQWDLVQNKDQVSELAAYYIAESREFTIETTVGPRFMLYRPGEKLLINLPEAGLINRKVVITSRQVDPSTGAVAMEFRTETDAKHAFCLGRTGIAPPSPVIGTPGDIDIIVSGAQETTGDTVSLIAASTVRNVTVSATSAGVVSVTAHERVYGDKVVSVNAGSVSVTASAGDVVWLFYDDPDRLGGAVTYQALVLPGGIGEVSSAVASVEHPGRHLVASGAIPASGTVSGSSDGTTTGTGTTFTPRTPRTLSDYP